MQSILEKDGQKVSQAATDLISAPQTLDVATSPNLGTGAGLSDQADKSIATTTDRKVTADLEKVPTILSLVTSELWRGKAGHPRHSPDIGRTLDIKVEISPDGTSAKGVLILKKNGIDNSFFQPQSPRPDLYTGFKMDFTIDPDLVKEDNFDPEKFPKSLDFTALLSELKRSIKNGYFGEGTREDSAGIFHDKNLQAFLKFVKPTHIQANNCFLSAKDCNLDFLQDCSISGNRIRIDGADVKGLKIGKVSYLSLVNCGSAAAIDYSVANIGKGCYVNDKKINETKITLKPRNSKSPDRFVKLAGSSNINFAEIPEIMPDEVTLEDKMPTTVSNSADNQIKSANELLDPQVLDTGLAGEVNLSSHDILSTQNLDVNIPEEYADSQTLYDQTVLADVNAAGSTLIDVTSNKEESSATTSNDSGEVPIIAEQANPETLPTNSSNDAESHADPIPTTPGDDLDKPAPDPRFKKLGSTSSPVDFSNIPDVSDQVTDLDPKDLPPSNPLYKLWLSKLPMSERIENLDPASFSSNFDELKQELASFLPLFHEYRDKSFPYKIANSLKISLEKVSVAGQVDVYRGKLTIHKKGVDYLDKDNSILGAPSKGAHTILDINFVIPAGVNAEGEVPTEFLSTLKNLVQVFKDKKLGASVDQGWGNSFNDPALQDFLKQVQVSRIDAKNAHIIASYAQNQAGKILQSSLDLNGTEINGENLKFESADLSNVKLGNVKNTHFMDCKNAEKLDLTNANFDEKCFVDKIKLADLNTPKAAPATQKEIIFEKQLDRATVNAGSMYETKIELDTTPGANGEFKGSCIIKIKGNNHGNALLNLDNADLDSQMKFDFVFNKKYLDANLASESIAEKLEKLFQANPDFAAVDLSKAGILDSAIFKTIEQVASIKSLDISNAIIKSNNNLQGLELRSTGGNLTLDNCNIDGARVLGDLNNFRLLKCSARHLSLEVANITGISKIDGCNLTNAKFTGNFGKLECQNNDLRGADLSAARGEVFDLSNTKIEDILQLLQGTIIDDDTKWPGIEKLDNYCGEPNRNLDPTDLKWQDLTGNLKDTYLVNTNPAAIVNNVKVAGVQEKIEAIVLNFLDGNYLRVVKNGIDAVTGIEKVTIEKCDSELGLNSRPLYDNVSTDEAFDLLLAFARSDVKPDGVIASAVSKPVSGTTPPSLPGSSTNSSTNPAPEGPSAPLPVPEDGRDESKDTQAPIADVPEVSGDADSETKKALREGKHLGSGNNGARIIGSVSSNNLSPDAKTRTVSLSNSAPPVVDSTPLLDPNNTTEAIAATMDAAETDLAQQTLPGFDPIVTEVPQGLVLESADGDDLDNSGNHAVDFIADDSTEPEAADEVANLLQDQGGEPVVNGEVGELTQQQAVGSLDSSDVDNSSDLGTDVDLDQEVRVDASESMTRSPRFSKGTREIRSLDQNRTDASNYKSRKEQKRLRQLQNQMHEEDQRILRGGYPRDRR